MDEREPLVKINLYWNDYRWILVQQLLQKEKDEPANNEVAEFEKW